MFKSALKQLVLTFRKETHDVLQMIYDELNTGQRKKLLKNEKVKKKFDQYGVQYSEDGK